VVAQFPLHDRDAQPAGPAVIAAGRAEARRLGPVSLPRNGKCGRGDMWLSITPSTASSA
jgi:hypothetical protein